MKRFLIPACLVVAAAVGAWLYFGSAGQKAFAGDEDSYKTVSVQLKPNLFYPVRVPTEAVLLRSNYETNYEYDLLTVSRYDTLPGNCDTAVKVGDAYIAAYSKTGMLAATQKGFDTEEPYSVYADWDTKEYAEGTPAVPVLPGDAVQTANSTYTVKGVGTAVTADNAVAWFAGDGFLQSAVVFSGYTEAIDMYAAKFAGLYGVNFAAYHHLDGVFFAQAGDFYVGVRYINKNTQYVISGKGDTLFPYFMNSLYRGGSPVGNGGNVTMIPKETVTGGAIGNETDK
jgi:hypothetical protein